MASNAEIVAQAQQLYVSYYGRPADPGGLDFWIEYFTNTDDGTTTLTDRAGSLDGTYNGTAHQTADAGTFDTDGPLDP